MRRRFFRIVLLGILGACTSETSESQFAVDVPGLEMQSASFDIPPGECWWCVDAEDYFDLSITTVVTDEGKLNADGYKTIWWGDVDLDTGKGTFGYTRTQADKLDCRVHYPVVSSAPGPPCDACFFTWTMSLGEVFVAEDMGGCKDAFRLEGATIHYGHGTELVFQNYGFILYVDEGAGWQEVGVSLVENQTRWTFFHDVVEEGVE